MRRDFHRHSTIASLLFGLVIALTTYACEDIEVADFNPEFRPVPTIERAPTVQTAPTIAAAPTTTQFQGFKQAPTATQFEGFKQAPTVTQAEGFKTAPTATQFQGFNDDEDTNPCTSYLDDPTPENAKAAADWAAANLEPANNQLDPNNTQQITTACQAALKNDHELYK